VRAGFTPAEAAGDGAVRRLLKVRFLKYVLLFAIYLTFYYLSYSWYDVSHGADLRNR
jgi:hypothetical protein